MGIRCGLRLAQPSRGILLLHGLLLTCSLSCRALGADAVTSGQLEEIVVTAPRIKNQVVSTLVQATQAARVPGTQGDVLKVVENLPGVARAAVGSGTLVVWDIDPFAEVINAYRSDAPDHPVKFGPGQIAAAEPAVPGWRVAVDQVFR